MEKKCGNCVHFHHVNVPKSKKDIYKSGRCGLGYHNPDDVPTCRVYRDKDMPPAPKNEPNAVKAFSDRFISNPWAQWVKKDDASVLRRMMNGGEIEKVEMNDPRNRIIYDVIMSMDAPIDYLTVLYELKKRGLFDKVGMEHFKSITQ